MNKDKIDKLIFEIYVELFANSTPKGDFESLVENAEVDSRGQKSIPFNDYEILEEDFNTILERSLKGKRLSKLTRAAIRNGILLGCSPKFKN